MEVGDSILFYNLDRFLRFGAFISFRDVDSTSLTVNVFRFVLNQMADTCDKY